MKTPKTRLLDVARHAKVSPATVSRVANGNPQVDPEIASKVYETAKQLGVDLTLNRKNRTIAFVLGNRDTVNEFQSKVLLGAEGYCAQNDWDLQFISFRRDLNAPPTNMQLPHALTKTNRPAGSYSERDAFGEHPGGVARDAHSLFGDGQQYSGRLAARGIRLRLYG